ncbi:MAG TPA: hypothetical protein VML96_08520 [Egibacteraceae bacterium]|nr:hypothetical protein [Egibacteraceae bacterium]
MPPRSLFDGVDLDAVRSLAARLPPPGGVVVACLAAGGALAQDPSDPAWTDRDRLFVSPGLRRSAETAGLQAEADGADPHACALESQRAGAIFRVYWVLDRDAAGSGEVWERARAAAGSQAAMIISITLASAAQASPAARMWEAAGWTAHGVDGNDPVAVLGAIDRGLEAPAPWAIIAAVDESADDDGAGW